MAEVYKIMSGVKKKYYPDGLNIKTKEHRMKLPNCKLKVNILKLQ